MDYNFERVGAGGWDGQIGLNGHGCLDRRTAAAAAREPELRSGRAGDWLIDGAWKRGTGANEAGIQPARLCVAYELRAMPWAYSIPRVIHRSEESPQGFAPRSFCE